MPAAAMNTRAGFAPAYPHAITPPRAKKPLTNHALTCSRPPKTTAVNKTTSADIAPPASSVVMILSPLSPPFNCPVSAAVRATLMPGDVNSARRAITTKDKNADAKRVNPLPPVRNVQAKSASKPATRNAGLSIHKANNKPAVSTPSNAARLRLSSVGGHSKPTAKTTK